MTRIKLVNAKLYKDDIKKRMWERWYDEKYQWYFGNSPSRINDFDIDSNHGNSGYGFMHFAVLNANDELIGYISYAVDTEVKVAQWFGAMNFSDDVFAFGQALWQVIIEAFMKYGMEVVEWHVIRGNPAEASYDRMIQRLGGRIMCVRRHRALDMAGNPCDDKIYEVTRSEFLTAMRNHPMVRAYEAAER